MTRQPRCPRSGRSAFTVIELLVVIGIIAVVVSLTVAAVGAIILAQEKSTTEGHIRKVNTQLENAIRAVLDQAKEKDPPQSVLLIAGGDIGRAKIIWQKLQLKRNFPMTYAEALAPWNFTGNTAMPKGNPLTQADLPPLQVFVDGLKGVPVAQFGTNPQAEMGALLALTLSVNRRGSTFNVEQDLGPSALADTNTDGVREIVDLWGQPLAFFRWPTDNADLDATKPFTASNPGDPRRDPQDPEGRLVDTSWNTQVNAQPPTKNNPVPGVYWFELLCHRIHDPAQKQWTPVAYYMVPTIVSSGPNKRLGLLLAPTTVPPQPYTPWQPTYTPPYFQPGNPMMGSPNWGMYPDMNDTKNNPPTGPLTSVNDNIFSYTLK